MSAPKQQARCTTCQQPIHWIDCPTGGWWRHDQHPADGHDAEETVMPTRTRAYYLSPPDFHRLDWACRPIATAYDSPVYLVGSVLTTSTYRDIDLRLILPDDHPAAAPGAVRMLLNIALSDLITKTAGSPRPVDFQIQSQTEADAEDGARNPLGIAGLGGRL